MTDIFTRGIAKVERIAFEKWYNSEKNSSRIHILCFHDVEGEGSIYNISRDKLLGILESLDSDRFISLDQACEILNEGNRRVDLAGDTSHDRFVLTFDDGYAGPVKHIVPYLKDKSIPFTLYITTDFLGQSGYLSKEGLMELSRVDGCTIGSHMVTHMHTRLMRIKDIRNEWKKSKSILEDIIDRSVVHAALPYGDLVSCSYRSMREALRNGYRTVASTMAAPAKGRILPRYVYQSNAEKRIYTLVQ